MSNPQSVSQWIVHLKEGEEVAAQRLWDRYAKQLIDVAKRQLGVAPKGIADEEDIAASVFHSLCRGAAEGRMQNVKSRDDLWWILLAITKHKVVDHTRRELAAKRGTGRVKSESALGDLSTNRSEFTLDELTSDAPTPEIIAILTEQYERLFNLLRNEQLRQIAKSRIEGYTVCEIANDLCVSIRSIERKLQLIRNAWSQELGL